MLKANIKETRTIWHRKKLTNIIRWEMHGFSHQFLSTEKCNKTHRMDRTWEIGTYIFPIV